MTERDFTLIAYTLNVSREEFGGSQPHLDALNFIANVLSDAFEKVYPAFSRDEFLNVCGEGDG